MGVSASNDHWPIASKWLSHIEKRGLTPQLSSDSRLCGRLPVRTASRNSVFGCSRARRSRTTASTSKGTMRSSARRPATVPPAGSARRSGASANSRRSQPRLSRAQRYPGAARVERPDPVDQAISGSMSVPADDDVGGASRQHAAQVVVGPDGRDPGAVVCSGRRVHAEHARAVRAGQDAVQRAGPSGSPAGPPGSARRGSTRFPPPSDHSARPGRLSAPRRRRWRAGRAAHRSGRNDRCYPVASQLSAMTGAGRAPPPGAGRTGPGRPGPTSGPHDSRPRHPAQPATRHRSRERRPGCQASWATSLDPPQEAGCVIGGRGGPR